LGAAACSAATACSPCDCASRSKIRTSTAERTPNPEDFAATCIAIEAGKMINIEVLDHLVIGNGKHVSLKERGLGFG
jgi:hypothetical protein